MTHAEEVCSWMERKDGHGYNRQQRQREGDKRSNQERGTSQRNLKAKRELEFEDGNQKGEMGQNRERGYNGQPRWGNRPGQYNGRGESSKRYKKVETQGHGEAARTDLNREHNGLEKENYKLGIVPNMVAADEGSTNTGLERNKTDETKLVTVGGTEGVGEKEEGEMGKDNEDDGDLLSEEEEGEYVEGEKEGEGD